jgi:lysozyme
MAMKINSAGLSLIKQFEGCKLTAYADPVGILTIGVGHTGPDVKPGMVITQERAENLLSEDLAHFEREVFKRLKVATNRNQFSAMVAFCFNIGAGNFARCSVLRQHNASNPAKAAEAYLLWNKATGADGVKRELKGLTRRRAAEAALYLTPTVEEQEKDPQRTRASDVEPSPVASSPPVSGAQIATGGLVSGASLAGIQAVSQVSQVWSWLIDNGIEPKVVLAVMGAALVAALIGLGWKLMQARRVAG